MLKIAALPVLALLQSAVPAAAQWAPQPGQYPPAQPPATPPAVSIAVYSTDETFTFESEVQPALNARLAALKAAGVTTLGGRVVEAGNDYSFVIEYVPSVKGSAAQPPAVIVDTYRNGASYWVEREADEARRACEANFRNARLPVLNSYLYEQGSDTAFAVDFLQKDLLRQAPEHDVKIKKYTGGKFTFESQAEKAAPGYLNLFRQAGVPALRARAVPAGRDYAVEVEYVTRAGRSAPRPQYSVARYNARETFTFDSQAKPAAAAALPKFTAAGAPGLSAVVLKAGGDYSYAVDFLVSNIYQYNGVIPSVAVQSYQAPEAYTFESEAGKARDEKAAAFAAAGYPVVGSAVTGSIGAYTYALDFIARAGQQQPSYPQAPRP